MIGLTHYLVLSAVLFCIGLYGTLTRRNAVSEALRLHEEAKKQCAQGRYEHS